VGRLEADAAFLLCTNPLEALHRLIDAAPKASPAPGPGPTPASESGPTPSAQAPESGGDGSDVPEDPAGFDDLDHLDDPARLFDDRDVKDWEPHGREDDDGPDAGPGAGPPGSESAPEPEPDSNPLLVPESAIHPSRRDEPCPTCGHDPTGGRGDNCALRWGDLPDLRDLDPAKLRPTAVLYLHASETEFRGGRGVVRLENDGTALTPAEAIDLLGHCHVKISRVIDLNDHQPVDAYEIPERIAEQVRLAWPTTVFPYSATSSRASGVDLDHPDRYVPPAAGGPTGQTGLHNLAPLLRSSHRVKTHGPGWTTRQPVFGLHLWRTPHGYCFQQDAFGATPLGKMTSEEFSQFTRELAEQIAWEEEDDGPTTAA
jgi:hypothetical protein